MPFFSISAAEFVEIFAGIGASRVRDLFEQAKKSAPCIIFIDEIDAVGRQRSAGFGQGNDEREQTVGPPPFLGLWPDQTDQTGSLSFLDRLFAGSGSFHVFK